MVKVLLKNSEEIHNFSPCDFEKIMNVKWQDTLIFQTPRIRRDVFSHSRKAIRKKELDMRERWIGTYYQKQIKTGFLPLISIRFIDNTFGFGVFAEKDIPKGSFIGEYTGLVRKRRRFRDKKNYYCFEYTIGDWLRNPYIIDANLCGNHTRFINHSDEANLETISVYADGVMHIVFVALKAIKKGQQLCYHYGDYFWTRRRAPKKLGMQI